MPTCDKCGRRQKRGEEWKPRGSVVDKTFWIGKACGCWDRLQEDLKYSAANVAPGKGVQAKPRKEDKPAIPEGYAQTLFDAAPYVVIRDADKDGGSKRGADR
jgi:hypothetical protein